ncbi:MAG TPA: hypothetical protein VI386_34040, partial [Candidatus Sulfotelmatobacter sp.]
FQAWNLKEQHCFIFGGIGLSPLPLKANKTSAAIELSMVTGLLIRNCKTERFLIKILCPFQVIEIKLNPDESRSDWRTGCINCPPGSG